MTISFNRLLFSRLTIWLALTLAGTYFVYYIKDYVTFGIDLVGGSYITLEVDVKKAREIELNEKMRASIDLLTSSDQPIPQEKRIDKDVIRMKFDSIQDAVAATDFLLRHDPHTLIKQENSSIVIQFSPEQIKAIDSHAVEGNIVALNSRMNAMGTGEILIARQGEHRIVIELPDVHNLQTAKAMIGKAALLEIKPVEDMANSEEKLLEKYNNELPEGTEIVPGRLGDKTFYLVSKHSDLTGRQLKTAKQDFGGPVQAEPVVAFEFNSVGAQRFYDLTSANVGNHLAILIDGVVITAPTVNSAISGGKAIISGNFTPQSAQELATMLRSGAFVAPVTFEEERQIGPTLGQESIYQGLLACGVAMVLLFFFSVIVYKMSGLLAFIVLIYNLLLTLVMLWMLGATLTLPGIAGMVLTIGMAIDASILIYERMRELLAEKMSFRRAIDEGFAGAFEVIIDSNLTNLLIAVVLYYLGSGPIQGFAVTMIVGIVATLLTGLWLLRSMFTFVTDVLGINKLSI